MPPILRRSSQFFGLLSIALWAFGCGSSNPPAEAAHAEHPPEGTASAEHGGHEHGGHEHGGHEHGGNEHGGHEHGGHEHGGHPRLTGAAHEFHELLAPLWHANKSAEREAKTCDAVPKFEQHAAAVHKEVPESARADEAAYRATSQGLVTAVGDLKTECAKPTGGRAAFEAKFMAVHEAFHKVMDRSR